MSKKPLKIPDTFAGGMFNLPLIVAKLVRLAGSPNEHEAASAKAKLLEKGYFLDRVGVLWEKDKVPEWAKD